MQKTYFHVDRLDRLVPGQKVQALYLPKQLAEFKTNRADMLASLYPEGLSYHGQRYLIDSRSTPDKDIDGQIEVLVEFMRRTRFPRRPSRYQSLFACRSIEEAMKFKLEFGDKIQGIEGVQAKIWEVETKRPVFEADMRLLTHGENWADCFVRHEWYWRQHFSDDPLIEVTAFASTGRGSSGIVKGYIHLTLLRNSGLSLESLQ